MRRPRLSRASETCCRPVPARSAVRERPIRRGCGNTTRRPPDPLSPARASRKFLVCATRTRPWDLHYLLCVGPHPHALPSLTLRILVDVDLSGAPSLRLGRLELLHGVGPHPHALPS